MFASDFGCLRQIWMLVNVEYAPDLIVCTATATFGLPDLLAFGVDCMLNELKRTATEWVDSDEHTLAVSAPPVR